MSREGAVKLAQAGLAEFFERVALVRYGQAEDVRYLAPESLETGRHSVEADMYSVGCLALGTFSRSPSSSSN